VRNRRDGSVEVLLQGPRDACDRLARACVEGPRAARVTLVEIAQQSFDATLTGFEQRPTN
jgi:acylphosphatase